MTPSQETQQKAIAAARAMFAHMNDEQKQEWAHLSELAKNPESSEWKNIVASVKASKQPPITKPDLPSVAASDTSAAHSPLIIQPIFHENGKDFRIGGSHEVVI